eukprot:scaffold271_cov36-Phaeocystis_antarctica.AAC.1
MTSVCKYEHREPGCARLGTCGLYSTAGSWSRSTPGTISRAKIPGQSRTALKTQGIPPSLRSEPSGRTEHGGGSPGAIDLAVRGGIAEGSWLEQAFTRGWRLLRRASIFSLQGVRSRDARQT